MHSEGNKFFFFIQFPDYKFPFKKSFHHVCIHDTMSERKIRLKNCYPPDVDKKDNLRVYQYVEAKTCKCSRCSTSIASCEGLGHSFTTSATTSRYR